MAHFTPDPPRPKPHSATDENTNTNKSTSSSAMLMTVLIEKAVKKFLTLSNCQRQAQWPFDTQTTMVVQQRTKYIKKMLFLRSFWIKVVLCIPQINAPLVNFYNVVLLQRYLHIWQNTSPLLELQFREITISRGTDLRVHLCSDSAKHKHFPFVLGQGRDKGWVVATVYPNRSLGK